MPAPPTTTATATGRATSDDGMLDIDVRALETSPHPNATHGHVDVAPRVV